MSFSADISRFIGKTEKIVERSIRRICMDLFVKVVEKSPVDKGRFRGNWFLTINTPSNQGGTGFIDKGKFRDPPDTANYSRADSASKGYKIGDAAIYLTNNLPYAYRLETGYSKQAPSGMARLSVMEIASKYK
jgi:hypothetical protein